MKIKKISTVGVCKKVDYLLHRKAQTRQKALQKKYQMCAAVTVGVITAVCLFPYQIRVQDGQIRVRTLLADLHIHRGRKAAEPETAKDGESI